MGLIKPAVNTSKRVGGAGFEVGRATAMGVGDLLSKLGMTDVANKYYQSASRDNPILKTDQDIQSATSPMQMAKDSAGLLAFGVPGGVGSKAISRGAIGGAMSGFGGGSGQDATSILGETALGALTGGATGGVLNKLLGAKAAQEAVKIKPTKLQGVLDSVGESAANKFTKASPTSFRKASQAGIDLNKVLPKYVGKGGTTYEALLGLPDEAGKGGSLNMVLNDAEQKLQSAISNRGDMIVASQDDLLAPIMARKANLSKLAGEKSKVGKIDEFADEIKALYPNGVNAKQALDVKRAMDARFGQSVISDETATITSDLQKMMANTLRKKLKGAIPEVADALDTQSEVLTIRPVIEHARSVGKTQGSTIRRGSAAGIELQRPMSFLDPILGNQKVSSAMSRLQSQAGQGVKDAVPEQAAKMSPAIMQILSGVIAPQAVVNGSTEPVMPNGEAVAQEMQPQQPMPERNTTYQFPGTEQATGGNKSQELQQVITALMIVDPKNADVYKGIMAMQSGGGGLPTRDLPAAQVSSLGDIDTSINLMANLDAAIAENEDLLGPIKGSLGKVNPYNTDAQAFNSQMTSAAQIVGKAMEEGVLRKEDEEKYKKMLPQITDTPAVAKRKLQIVKDMLEQQRQVKQQTFGEFGFGGGSGNTSESDVLQQILMMGGY